MIMADCLYWCVMEIYFCCEGYSILNITMLRIYKLVSFKDQTCTLKCMFTN